jgi:5-hydroxyisourate hydrolase-like protein (transthyretin family)
MRKKRFPHLLILFGSLLLLLMLAGCQKSSEQASPDVTPLATVAQSDGAMTAPASSAPATLTIQTTLRPAIDPACLKDTGKFTLVSASLPEDGLEPGMMQVFCATGAPAGETVTFTLKSPDKQEQTYQVPSMDQGTVAAAVLPVTIGADAEPGKWTLTAVWQDQKDAVTFDVKPASQPFVALAEPISDNPSVIHVAVGGLEPNALARFAIYRIQPGQTEGDKATARGKLLLESMVQVDEEGRADLSLDVADQPSGPYLLALLPADGSQEVSSVIELPQQERTALAINNQRQGAAAVASEETGPGNAQESTAPPTSPTQLPAPQLTEAGGGLPESTTVSLPDAQLPSCTPTAEATVQLWPHSGEVGQWWYGCASGFTPEKPLRVDATLGNGTTTSFDLTKTDADGVKSFRWYSLPEEGSGNFSISVSDLVGNKADATWTISPATHPHLLIYPHVVIKDVGAQLILTQFPTRAKVQVGVYKIDSAGTATLVKKMTLKTDKRGVVQQAFSAVNELEPGTYMAVAQSAPTYQFPGIDTPATDVEFFSVGAPLDEKYEAYTLFVGRETGTQVAVGGESAQATPAAEATPVPTSQAGVPATLTIPVDNSAPPTCPDAQAGSPTICMTPTKVQRATYTYMLMHDFKPGTKFVVTVTSPKGVAVKFFVQANDAGMADAHWYALNDEQLGTYKVRIRGGKEVYVDSFKIVKATSPHVVVQPRSPKPGTPVVISISGLKPNATYVLARYRSTGDANGQVQFELMDTVKMTTGKGGGAKKTFATSAADGNALFLAAVYEQDGSQPLAKEVYAPGQELYLRYPFAWAKTAQ